MFRFEGVYDDHVLHAEHVDGVLEHREHV